jgi:uncharacterized protein (TIGR03435 family)
MWLTERMRHRELISIAAVASLGQASAPPHDFTLPVPVSFEIASIRKDVAPLIPVSRIATFPGGRFQANARLRDIVAYAFALQPFQLVIGSAPVLEERYAIAAKTPEQVAQSRETQLQMLRSLLASRFSLATHFEEVSMPVTVMTRADMKRLGPQLHSVQGGCARVQAAAQTDANIDPSQQLPRCHVTFINGRMQAHVEDMADFARGLSALSHRAFVDETGLKGSFEFEFTFNPATLLQGMPLAAPPSMDELHSFNDAMLRELGLRVQNRRRAVRMLRVDHIEEPTTD